MSKRFFPEDPIWFSEENVPRFLSIPYWYMPPAAGSLDLEFVMPETREVELCCVGMAGYQLLLDGEVIHRGPEWSGRGLIEDKFKVTITAGKHFLQIMLWNFGTGAGIREMHQEAAISIYPADGDKMIRDLIGTGYAPYYTQAMSGIKTAGIHMSCMAAPRLKLDYRMPAEDRGPASTIALAITAAWQIFERSLPLMREERWEKLQFCAADEKITGAFCKGGTPELKNWSETLASGGKITIPPHRRVRMLFDCSDYICAFANVKFKSGKDSQVEIMLTEALFCDNEDWRKCYYKPVKGNRSEIEGKFAAGTGDLFIADGQEHTFSTFDWDAGRYLVIKIDTADQPLELEDFHLTCTGYPLDIATVINWSDEQLNRVRDLCTNSLLKCMHSTYMDCPHYEQLMYAGDGRLEMLTTYMLSADRRLPRKALREFAFSKLASGYTLSRFPSREKQLIPPFALYFIAMIHDYARWDDDPELVQDLLPIARQTIEAFLRCREKDGDLICNPAGWNFYDWPFGWDNGVPPGQPGRPGALLNCHLIYTLERIADLEEYTNSSANAAAYRAEAARLRTAVQTRFFDTEKHLFSDEETHTYYSQQTQSMALLAGLGDREVYENMFRDYVTPCTVYFSHYIFEASKLFGDGERTMKLLKFWKDLPAQGFMTTPERPEPSRSDCHGWGAHPLHYMVTGIAGIEPVGFGGRVFRITPVQGRNIPDGTVKLVLPAGSIEVTRCCGNIDVKTTGNITVKQS